MNGKLALAGLVAMALVAPAIAEPAFKAGIATTVITPTEPMWMAGYAFRNKPAEGKLHDLYVKVLALEDPAGERLVVLTSDLVGIPRSLAEAVAEEVRRRTGLPRERLMLTVSHTHCGPVVRDNLIDMLDLPAGEADKIKAYGQKLQGWMVETIVAALADLKPAKLSTGWGTAGFAVNRREPTPKGVVIGRNPAGPVDHNVPVLRVDTPDGKLRAVLFGYACHNTTLGIYQWNGDYAGFAQAYLEERHPGVKALFYIGCGGDANPLPRSSVELCQRHGRELADAVDAVLAKPLTPVAGTFAARWALLDLPFDSLPTKEQWAADLLSKNTAVRQRAARFLKILDNGGTIDNHYRFYPVQVWRLGDDLLWIALGGEVVIDYNLRLRNELAGRRLWVAGYANDVMAYIPSARVLKEGGYEADSSMIYYGMPARWAPAIEDKIIAKVHELVKEVAPSR
ncbi:MAG: hypothetical protein NZ700_02500 [Gemmataceae bacterium]|nr:hypothetical protein [Gemmataceae bacterium]MDW8264298.1 hypothetical protein [Gemmataceae bacterium]